ncbi:CBS domain-containing protein [Mycolicibacterium poriferae]|jgi:CBS domain-containing protein|uniref:Histidine kinase n=1 Tax=Mycolicibacterium poriferae TaxID=39694 RepID=A0A6N4VDV0_9MYCO|nr:CBS domain-containing protein [Mycolicibacterium poriferae]MCV7264413.1 CBS domain-containing protein [Mycolicibacterium poriferae]BBX52791.1 histidine kinase [Mycolicibacterium poriferae]
MTRIPLVGSAPVSTLTGDSVARVSADASIADVARALVSRDVGMVVVGDEQRPAAVLSERDVVRVVAAGSDPTTVRAGDVASTRLVWASAEDTVDEVANRMMEHYIRHILVEQDGSLVGVVSARDLLGPYSSEAAEG